MPRQAIHHLTKVELALSNETEQRICTEFDAAIKDHIGGSFTLPPTTAPSIVYAWGNGTNTQGGDFKPYLNDKESPEFVPQAKIHDAAGKPILQKSFADTMIISEVLLSHGYMNGLATVLKQSVDDNGKKIGSWNDNPMLNTLVYECEFSNGTVK